MGSTTSVSTRLQDLGTRRYSASSLLQPCSSEVDMLGLYETVRFNVGWSHRNDPKPATNEEIDAEINAMSPLQLLEAISLAYEDMKAREND
jgi:hypothetical protein